MNKSLLFLLLSTTLCAETIILDNQTSYPNKTEKAKMALQWASTAREVAEENNAILYDAELNVNMIQTIAEAGKIPISLPSNAQYFRILVWSKGKNKPDLHTNWVDVIPDKVYTLEADHLVPSVLMVGSGC